MKEQVSEKEGEVHQLEVAKKEQVGGGDGGDGGGGVSGVSFRKIILILFIPSTYTHQQNRSSKVRKSKQNTRQRA